MPETKDGGFIMSDEPTTYHLELEQPTPQFVLDTREKIEWALRKLAQIDNEEAILKAQYETIQGDLKRRRENWQRQFSGQVEEWARQQAEGQRTKTVKTLAGNLAFRTVAASLVVAEGEEVLAEQEAIRLGHVKPVEPDMTAYRKSAAEWLDATGELRPGLNIRPARESFSISIPKPGKEKSDAS